MKNVIGLVDCHTSPELGELTADRPLASTSFLGRYAFIDFALSNFCNSDIDQVGVLIKNHQRSILKHLGGMLSWLENTKTGHQHILFNEYGSLNQKYNSDLNNLKANDWILYDLDAEHIIITPAHIVMCFDFRPMLEEHIARGEDITFAYKRIRNANKEFLSENVVTIDGEGYIASMKENDGTEKIANVDLETIIVKRSVLSKMIELQPTQDASSGIREMLKVILELGLYKAHAYEFKGYAKCFDSLQHYVEYSFDMLDIKHSSQLFGEDWPIFTLTHDSKPALYGERCMVSNSFVSNGCIVEGSVKDSILCRHVELGEGSTLRRCIILSGTKIGENVNLSNVIVDKYCVISAEKTLGGSPEAPLYVKQGAKI